VGGLGAVDLVGDHPDQALAGDAAHGGVADVDRQAVHGGAALALRLVQPQREHRRLLLRPRSEHHDRGALLDLGDPQRVLLGSEAGQRIELVVEVGGAEGLAGEALEQPRLLVGALGRAQHADGVGPVLVTDGAQPTAGLLDGLLDADLAVLFAITPHHGSAHPVGAIPAGDAVAPAVAEPHVVDERVVPRGEALHLVLAAVDVDVAAIGTLRAHTPGSLEVPGAGDEAVLAVGERAHRADLGEVALEGGAQRPAVEGRHRGLHPALLEDDLLLAGDLVVVAHAAPAEDTALLVELDAVRQRHRLVEVHLVGDRHPRRLGTVADGEVLEVALAAAVADRAVERVVEEQELEHTLTRLRHRVGLGVDHHPLADVGGAGRLQLGHLLDLDQAHPAHRHRVHLGMGAVDRDVDAHIGCGVEHQLALGRAGHPSVDGDLDAAVVGGRGRGVGLAHGSTRSPRAAALAPGRRRRRSGPRTRSGRPCTRRSRTRSRCPRADRSTCRPCSRRCR